MADILENTLGIAKITSNLHAEQRQVLVEPLSLPGVTRHINKFLARQSKKRPVDLPLHTSGFNCDWLKE